VTVYEPPVEVSSGGDNEVDPGFLPVYTDIESWRRWQAEVFVDDAEEVVATEKIHGANGRFAWAQDRLWCGSRTQVKREDPRSMWWLAAAAAGLAEKLRRAEGFVLYGEVYGVVQDLRYGVGAGVRFVAFDALEIATRRYVDRDAFVDLCARLDLPTVPELFRGPVGALRAIADATANGKTVLANGACVREGFVVKPVRERWHPSLGRVVLKLVGEDYHLRKGG
jgi:RNA ligase (TIGR02306 family)